MVVEGSEAAHLVGDEEKEGYENKHGLTTESAGITYVERLIEMYLCRRLYCLSHIDK